jgi:hypothetical protein
MADEDFGSWKQYSPGRVILSMVTKAEALPMRNGMVAVRIFHAPTGSLHDAIKEGTAQPEVLQVMMENSVARELAKALLDASNRGRN